MVVSSLQDVYFTVDVFDRNRKEQIGGYGMKSWCLRVEEKESEV